MLSYSAGHSMGRRQSQLCAMGVGSFVHRSACAVVCVLVGCSLESEGTGNGAPPGLGAFASTGQAVDPSASGGGGTGGGQLSDSNSGGNSSDPSGSSASDSDAGGSSGVDGTSGDTGSATADPTTGPDSDGDTGVMGGMGDGDTGGTPPMSAHVGYDDWGTCNDTVYCANGFGQPTGPFWIQKCFDSPVPPPYRVTAVQFFADYAHWNLDPIQVQVRNRKGDGEPGMTVWNGNLPNIDDGTNSFGFDQDPLVDTDGFCVGFYIDGVGGQDAGLGVGVHTNGPAQGDSWYAGCDVEDWADLLSQVGSNWCMAADIVAD